MSEQIDLYNKIQDPFSAAIQMGAVITKSGMFGCSRPEEGTIIALACMAERKSPFEIKRTFHLINGNLTMRADAMLANFRAKGGKHKILEQTPERAAVQLTIEGETATFELTWADAQKEPFVWKSDSKTPKTNWATPRARLQTLWARVVSQGVRSMAPEVVAGVYAPEELDAEVVDKPLLVEKPATVTEIKTVTAPAEPPPAPASQEPVQSPTTSPAMAQIDQKTGKLTVETVQAVEAAIGEQHAAAALKWLEARKWIKPMGSLMDLSTARAQSILDHPKKFQDTISTK
jgi:hypothetical protein